MAAQQICSVALANLLAATAVSKLATAAKMLAATAS